MFSSIKVSRIVPKAILDLISNSYSDIFGSRLTNSTPAANIISTKEEYILELSVPGLQKKDIKITLEQEVLEISANKEPGSRDKAVSLRDEFNFSNFNRAFIIPEDVDLDTIRAACTHGILRVSFQKRLIFGDKTKKDISID